MKKFKIALLAALLVCAAFLAYYLLLSGGHGELVIDVKSGPSEYRVDIASTDESFHKIFSQGEKIFLAPGDYAITIFAENYLNFTHDIAVEKGRTAEVSAVLAPSEYEIYEGAPVDEDFPPKT